MHKKTTAKATKQTVRKTSRKSTKKKANRPARKTTKKTPKKTARTPTGKTTKNKPVSKATKQSAKATSKAPTEKLSKADALKKGKRPILVPLDFSPHSEAALVYAAHLAKRLAVPLAVLHVVHDPGEAPGYYRVKGRKKQLRKLEDVASEMLDEFMTRMAKQHPKHPQIKNAKRLLVTGLPATRILELAKRINPKMVVMGSAGRTALYRFLLGSKAEQVLRICPFPVTIVKTQKND